MITVHDNRKTNERMLKDIELDGFFFVNDVLCRRVEMPDIMFYSGDGIPYIEEPTAKLGIMARDAWVDPVRDECITLSIEDWG